GSRAVDGASLAAACDVVLGVVAAAEAVVALRKADVDVETSLAAGDVAAEAAARGLESVVVATTDLVGRVTDALRDGDVLYEVTEAARAAE
ncbi:Crp/Fnr family transcriptional regulator, partial [Halogeometricum sp. CBA1124]|nr:Crp/Fnr family transcriptional regulator [Halogeometricum sp. CBA1124]